MARTLTYLVLGLLLAPNLGLAVTDLGSMNDLVESESAIADSDAAIAEVQLNKKRLSEQKVEAVRFRQKTQMTTKQALAKEAEANRVIRQTEGEIQKFEKETRENQAKIQILENKSVDLDKAVAAAQNRLKETKSKFEAMKDRREDAQEKASDLNEKRKDLIIDTVEISTKLKREEQETRRALNEIKIAKVKEAQARAQYKRVKAAADAKMKRMRSQVAQARARR